MGLFQTLSFLIVVIVVAILLYVLFENAFPNATLLNSFNMTKSVNLSYTTVTTQPYITHNQTIAYALYLINRDRANYSLGSVSLSNITSAQQHAESMLENHYFSHWDTYGMKPYMRYTLVGGNGAVEENIAYIYNSSGINVLNAIQSMEYNFMYNDLACCDNGHRDNILTPQHNQVSIGIAYNSTSIYLVEDFINKYITWISNTPSISQNGSTLLEGSMAPGYSLSSVQISYDPPVQPLLPSTLNSNSSPYHGPYSYGTTIAGVGYSKGNSYYFYKNTTTINATTYITNGQNFDIAFNLTGSIAKYGAGEYTLMVYLDNSSQSPFMGSTYTLFVNQNGAVYSPQNV